MSVYHRWPQRQTAPWGREAAGGCGGGPRTWSRPADGAPQPKVTISSSAYENELGHLGCGWKFPLLAQSVKVIIIITFRVKKLFLSFSIRDNFSNAVFIRCRPNFKQNRWKLSRLMMSAIKNKLKYICSRNFYIYYIYHQHKREKNYFFQKSLCFFFTSSSTNRQR